MRATVLPALLIHLPVSRLPPPATTRPFTFGRLATRRERSHSLIADEDSILAFVWTPDGKTIITSSSDGSIRIRDAATLDPLRVIDHQPEWVEALAISPDGTRLAAGRFDGTLSLYDVKNDKVPAGEWAVFAPRQPAAGEEKKQVASQ